MFTGIITDVGQVVAVEPQGDTRFRLKTGYDLKMVAIGASICCSGVCLTVVEKSPDEGVFDVDVSAETLRASTLGAWQVGTRVNFERSLRLGDEMGGHIVTGHVDGLARVVTLKAEGDSVKITVELPDSHAGLVARKGSITLDGVSLTVNGVEGNRCWINVIPHTQEHTTICPDGYNSGRGLVVGSLLNFEVDVLARYVARLQDWRTP